LKKPKLRGKKEKNQNYYYFVMISSTQVWGRSVNLSILISLSYLGLLTIRAKWCFYYWFL